MSRSELLLLHAIRVLGFADAGAIAERAQSSEAETRSGLREIERRGWAQEFSFAELAGWSLTDEGRRENERQLADERRRADPSNTIEVVYREFLPLNGRLLRACTDWQLRPTSAGRLGSNDHTDSVWDERILAELTALRDELAPLVARLSSVLERFSGYDSRFAVALRRAKGGQPDWVDKSTIDSCHRVWFQLHEDLIATLGLARGAEF